MKNPFSVFQRRLNSYFLTGLFAILPLALTIAILGWVAGIVNGYIGPRTTLGQLLQSLGYKFSPGSNLTLAYGMGIFLVLAAIFLLGLVLESGARKMLERLADKTLHQLPLVRSIYRTTEQLVNLVPNREDDRLKGMQVVFYRFGPDQGGTGVLALSPSPENFRVDGQDYRIVIIPTAPVPFGGAMLFVPAHSVIPMNMSLDTFVGSYMSMGVSMTEFDPNRQNTKV